MASQYHLARLADSAFERLGDNPSMLFDGTWYTSGQMRERALGFSTGLREVGLGPGDRVVVMLPNGPEVPITYTAVWRAGGVVTPAMFLLPPPEVARIIEDSEAALVVTSPDFLPTIRAALEGITKVKAVVSTGPVDEGVVSMQDLEGSGPSEIVDRDDSDLASLLYTGGTTGQSKGVMLTHENHAVCSKGLYDSSYQEHISSTITALPLAHAYGVMVTIATFFARKPERAFLMPWFEPSMWLGAIQEHKIQRATLVPSMLQILLSAPLEEYDLSSWEFAGVGAAPLAREVIEEFERRVPSCTVHEGYGCTESGGGASTSPPGKRKIGAVGKPMPGYEFKIVGEDGEQVSVGEPGEVCIRSAGVMKGYWNSPDVTASTIKDGWLHTGDVGKLDEDGYLYIVDRIKDLIIRGGFNVYPRDIEDVLLEHPDVQAAGVVGKPDEKYGEEIVAFVALHPGRQVEPEILIEFTKERIGRHKYPREVKLVPYLPLTPIGKVDRKALRKML